MNQLLLASELATKGDQRLGTLGPGVAWGMHTGSGKSINPKVWPCEDSLAVHCLADGGVLATVADAHWGGSSSEAVAQGLLPGWDGADGKDPGYRLERTLDAIQGRLTARDPEDPSETTALLVHLAADGVARFLSVGDSMLLLRTPQGLRQVNTPLPFFLGRTPLPRTPGVTVHAGGCSLAPGDLLLLATDGLEPGASGLLPRDVANELGPGGLLEERLGRLLAAASGTRRGGGRDNLALVAIEFSVS